MSREDRYDHRKLSEAIVGIGTMTALGLALLGQWQYAPLVELGVVVWVASGLAAFSLSDELPEDVAVSRAFRRVCGWGTCLAIYTGIVAADESRWYSAAIISLPVLGIAWAISAFALRRLNEPTPNQVRSETAPLNTCEADEEDA